MRKIFFFFLALILGFCANTIAQNPYLRHFSTLDGLPTNTIYQIYQDSQKFLWFTSDAGVIKFDGTNFTSYRKKDGLSSNDIVRIKEDFKGRIWIFSYNGAVNYIYNNIIYNGKNAPFLNSLIGKGFFLDFYTDESQSIHFYNYQRDIFSLDTNNNVSKDQLLKNIAGKLPLIQFDYDRMRLIYLSKNLSDEWLIWVNAGIYSQNTFQGKVSVVDTDLLCNAVFPDRMNTSYFIKTYSYDGKAYYQNKLFKVKSNFEKEEINFPGNENKIKSVIEDSEGYVWIAAYDEGVYCIKNNIIVKHFDIKDALGILQDHESNIWVSTQSNGIYELNHDLLEQNHFDLNCFDNHGVNLLYDFPGTGIWCTNTKSVYVLRNKVFYKLKVPLTLQPINILFQFKDKTLMLGTSSTRLYSYENISLNESSKEINYRKNKVFNYQIKKIISDKKGSFTAMFDQNRIMVTSSFKSSLNTGFKKISERINNAYYNAGNELVINAKRNYLYRNNKLEPYPELSRFDGTTITDQLVMGMDTELINIDGDSLYIFKDNKFYNLTDSFDMPIDKQINKILYEDSTLYIATLKDVFVCHNPIKVLTGTSIHIQPLNISFNNINDILVRQDTLYIASDDGLTTIAESSLTKKTSLPPIPYLQSVKVNEIFYSLPLLKLNLTGKNKIQLSFGSISYSSSTVIYSYMLQGAEDKWTVGSGNKINLVYQNLPRGEYVFKLRVRKSNSGWSNPLDLAITIRPTLIEYPAFWAFIVLIASGIILLIILRIRSQKMKKVEINHQLIVMEQKALQSMMNPHFIFNSLGSIQNFLLKNKGGEAILYLSQFAQLIRQNLNAINMPMIILEEEVDRLRNYIDLEKKRLDNNFNYAIEIEKTLEDESVYIPGMIIQPIAENSIWHGFATLEKNGFIKIQVLAYKPRSLKIIIEDNGVGVKKSMEYSGKTSHHKHLGMQIIEKRLTLLSKKYNTETGISYFEGAPGESNPGTVVELILPFVRTKSDF